MADILILTAPCEGPQLAAEQRAVQAFQSAILNQIDGPRCEVEVRSIDGLQVPSALGAERIYPMTLELPAWLDLHPIYAACRNVQPLQRRVAEWQVPVQPGDVWLPIVWTVKGPLYGELIGQVGNGSYIQPIHLDDSQRQPLYELGGRLLRSLEAPPSVYLMQVAVDGQQVSFDRLLPFPSAPALASLQCQMPDLFTCHWWCLAGQPIRELTIQG